MRNVLTITALMLGLLLGAMSVPAAAHGSHADLAWNGQRWHDCRVKPTGDRVRTTKRVIRCAVDHFPTSLRVAMYVADRESGYMAAADNGTCCAGVYQQHTTYWPGRVAAYNRAHRNGLDVSTSVYDARANVMVSIWMASRAGWSAWSTY